MDEAECGKRSALKGARCVWEGARSLDFAYFINFKGRIFIQAEQHTIPEPIPVGITVTAML